MLLQAVRHAISCAMVHTTDSSDPSICHPPLATLPFAAADTRPLVRLAVSETHCLLPPANLPRACPACARAGADAATSVLDPAGECWEAAGLYCMDGSTFPTPTGLNPMIT